MVGVDVSGFDSGAPDEKSTDVTINGKLMMLNPKPGQIPPPRLWDVYDLATTKEVDEPVVVGAASIVFATTRARPKHNYRGRPH